VIAIALVSGWLAPERARASDRVEVVVIESVEQEPDDTGPIPGTQAPPGPSSSARTIQVTERLAPTRTDTRTETTWFGVSAGLVAMPLSRTGSLSPTQRHDANPMHACIGSTERASCTALRGADFRLHVYGTEDAHLPPRVVGFLRSGYEVGQSDIDAPGGTRHGRGDATSLTYISVPVSLGFNLYAFKHFPVRPFVGAGVGADIVRLRYTRRDAAAIDRTVGRFAFDVHGGLEARFTNYVALTAEVRQQWGRRIAIDRMPRFNNTGLAVVVGLAISVPYGTVARRNVVTHRVTSVSRVTPASQPRAQRTRRVFVPQSMPRTYAPPTIAPSTTIAPPPPVTVPVPEAAPLPVATPPGATGNPLAPTAVVDDAT